MFLNTHTYYSLRYGTMKPEELLMLAQQHHVASFALTDINTTSACLDFMRLAPQYGIKPVLGVDFRNGVKQQFVMLARSNEGFKHINDYLASFLHEHIDIVDKPESLSDTYVIYPFASYKGIILDKHEFLGVTVHDLNKLKFSRWNTQLNKLVLLHTVSFQNKKGFNAHRLLRAIDNNTLLSKLPTSEQGRELDVFCSKEELQKRFMEYPELIENTQKLLATCSIEFDFSDTKPKNKETYTNNKALDFRLLRRLAYGGLDYRYKNPDTGVINRIEKELCIIQEKGFVPYFLINWKILKYARSKGYFYVGRGSGANSIIAYLLRITDVDPVELDLYFERFINLYRKNPPDFDIDFSWTDRDDIIEYIFKRFPNTALITVYNTFQYKAAIRELGKVFGLPKSEIDTLSSGHYHHDKLDTLSQLVITYSQLIQGFPNYLGIHAGGILISEKPIHYYTTTFMPPKGYPTTQFDMITAEDIGLFKFDILSQRGLGKIKDAVELVEQNNPQDGKVDIHDIKRFKEDQPVKHLLKNAEAIGCFYVESPAMRMLLKKLQVEDYLGLVAASSIIRPGVAKSGMMREYILRYRHPDRRKQAHPVMLEIMPETYGVMVYQEDVIKVAHYFGGLTLGEADMLRRGMSGKFRAREEFLKVKDQFFKNCHSSGKPIKLTREIWMQIESFAGYAFAKGHSASYAVESYQSLFLKAYYPLEYMVATLNNFGGFYRTEFYIHEARMHGGIIHPPCVNTSLSEVVIKGKEIYIGFMFLQSLEHQTIQTILTNRAAEGVFLDLFDFITRVPISLEQIAILIKIDAFRFTNRNKRELLWDAHMQLVKSKVREERVVSLFQAEKPVHEIPTLSTDKYEDAFDQIELLGFSLCSPFDLLTKPASSILKATELIQFVGQEVEIDGYLVTTKKTTTSGGKKMFFGTFLDEEGHFIDTVHFPPIAAKYPFNGRGVYKLKGKVTEEFESVSIEISEMNRLPIIEDPRYAQEQNRLAV